MKAVLISIQPQWVEKIAAQWKTMELRKSKPNIPVPFKCYIYQTRHRWAFRILRALTMFKLVDRLDSGFGKVVGEFVCDHILGNCEMANADIAEQQSHVRREKILQYSGGKQVFGWHISDLVIYDEPKDLAEFWSADKCPYASKDGCTYEYHCFRAGQTKRCGSTLQRPPQSWCYVEG